MDDSGTGHERRPRVLVVDDKASIRMLIAELLRSNGYDVVDAANGRLAVDVLDRQPFDLVITDALMPELGGRGLFEHIEKHHPQLLGKLIVITGHLKEDTEFFQTSTRVPILYKPFALDELLDTIKKTIH